MTITVDDRAFQAGLREALAEVDQHGRQATRGRADRVAARARTLVHVASGETRDSIQLVEVDHGAAFEIRADAPQSIFEEFGTSVMAPRPFLRPAAAEEV